MIFAREYNSVIKRNSNKDKEEEANRIQQYFDLYEDFDEAFIAVDWDLIIIHWNKAAERVTTVKAKEAIGKRIDAVLPEMITIRLTTNLYQEVCHENCCCFRWQCFTETGRTNDA